VGDDSTSLTICWSDGHKSHHPVDWLQERAFEDDQRQARSNMHRYHRDELKVNLKLIPIYAQVKTDMIKCLVLFEQ